MDNWREYRRLQAQGQVDREHRPSQDLSTARNRSRCLRTRLGRRVDHRRELQHARDDAGLPSLGRPRDDGSSRVRSPPHRQLLDATGPSRRSARSSLQMTLDFKLDPGRRRISALPGATMPWRKRAKGQISPAAQSRHGRSWTERVERADCEFAEGDPAERDLGRADRVRRRLI